MVKVRELYPIERPRERLAQLGPAALKDEELLAILLRTGYRGKTVLDLASGFLRNYPDGRWTSLSVRELQRVKGMGVSRAATLIAACELAKRFTKDTPGGLPAVTSPEQVIAQVSELREKKQEHFIVLYLNARNQVLRKETVSIGTLSASLVHPREVFAPAVEARAAAVVLTHNHPSGDPTPSPEDVTLTRRLSDAGKLLGIEVLDHVILGRERWISLKHTGVL
ncbi:MAG: DNA repair protein RadC [Elusimicrobia bacterium]|nr:DNA repair protein RadC [Elusimicrobiota bacterium]